MKFVRVSLLVAIPGCLIGWILFTLSAPWLVWTVFSLYVVERGLSVYYMGESK